MLVPIQASKVSNLEAQPPPFHASLGEGRKGGVEDGDRSTADAWKVANVIISYNPRIAV